MTHTIRKAALSVALAATLLVGSCAPVATAATRATAPKTTVCKVVYAKVGHQLFRINAGRCL